METEPKVKKARAPKATPQLRAALPRKEDGCVDWRKVVSPKNIILNPYHYAKIAIDVNEISEEETDRLKQEALDEGLIILLAGFREIAFKRGVKSTKYKLEERQDHRAVVSCEITLIPTEEEPYEVVISGLSNCSIDNCDLKYFAHAEALASNRSECRAWRQYLNISNVSFEELDPNDKPKISVAPQVNELLQKALDLAKLTASDIPGLMETGGYELGDKWNGAVESLEPAKAFTAIGILKKIREADQLRLLEPSSQ